MTNASRHDQTSETIDRKHDVDMPAEHDRHAVAETEAAAEPAAPEEDWEEHAARGYDDYF